MLGTTFAATALLTLAGCGLTPTVGQSSQQRERPAAPAGTCTVVEGSSYTSGDRAGGTTTCTRAPERR